MDPKRFYKTIHSTVLILKRLRQLYKHRWQQHYFPGLRTSGPRDNEREHLSDFSLSKGENLPCCR